MTDTQELNPRYVAYMREHGASSSDEMMARDRERWPGGVMCGFILWIGERWPEWKRATRWRGFIITQEDHDAFDAWLLTREQSHQ